MTELEGSIMLDSIPQDVSSKQCKVCLLFLPFDNFPSAPKNKDGLYNVCRDCRYKEALKCRALEKQCKKCFRILPATDFSPEIRCKDGLRSWCRSCHNDIGRRGRTPEKRNEAHLRQKYGISPEEYDYILTQQNGVCAICKRPETLIHGHGSKKGSVRSLSVDHCHAIGSVRSLLCHKCNTSLGLMNEDPGLIRALLEYSERCQSIK